MNNKSSSLTSENDQKKINCNQFIRNLNSKNTISCYGINDENKEETLSNNYNHTSSKLKSDLKYPTDTSNEAANSKIKIKNITSSISIKNWPSYAGTLIPSTHTSIIKKMTADSVPKIAKPLSIPSSIIPRMSHGPAPGSWAHVCVKEGNGKRNYPKQANKL